MNKLLLTVALAAFLPFSIANASTVRKDCNRYLPDTKLPYTSCKDVSLTKSFKTAESTPKPDPTPPGPTPDPGPKPPGPTPDPGCHDGKHPNNGHGNDADGNDNSNPGHSNDSNDNSDDDGSPGHSGDSHGNGHGHN